MNLIIVVVNIDGSKDRCLPLSELSIYKLSLYWQIYKTSLPLPRCRYLITAYMPSHELCHPFHLLDECQASDGWERNFSEIFNVQAKCRAYLFATSRFIIEITEVLRSSMSLEIHATRDDGRDTWKATCIDYHLSSSGINSYKKRLRQESQKPSMGCTLPVDIRGAYTLTILQVSFGADLPWLTWRQAYTESYPCWWFSVLIQGNPSLGHPDLQCP